MSYRRYVVELGYGADLHGGDATKAFYLHAPTLKSPMRGNVAAFATDADRKEAKKHFPGEEVDWGAVQKMFAEE